MLVMNGRYEDAGHEEYGHPERPDRVIAALQGVDELHLDADLKILEPYSATRQELARVHEGAYLDELGAFCYAGGGDIDEDTYATYDSWTIAQHAAGGGLSVVKHLQAAREGVGFVVTRPPGHHALRDRAMGFCLLNNIAVAAAALTDLGERVLIVDWDVHHGNGTQAIFWDDPNVLYVSTHQSPLFPGSGGAYEVGGGRAIGQTVNLPMPSGATGDILRQAIDEIAAPAIDEFKPTWVLVSAGFDAHRDDPMADLALTSGDFAQLAKTVAKYAPSPGRLALFLEGGYDLAALRDSVAATIGAVLESPYQPEAPSYGGPGSEIVANNQLERQAALRIARNAALREE